MITLLVVAGVIATLILIYLFIIRPYSLLWGASLEEVALELPGDQIVTKFDSMLRG